MGEVIRSAFGNVFEWHCLLVIVLSAAYGLFVGAIPGLTATMAVALMVPMTFFLSDVEALAAIVTTVTCSIFAGDIPAALVRIPGTPASAAYASDAYSLTGKGLHERALGISLVFSILGGLFGTLVLAVAAPQLARLATEFTSFEYFWLYLLGLTCAAIVSDDSRLKGFLALLLGMFLSTVGLGTDYSVPRLTIGFDQLVTGINFIPAMIGLFGISEVLRNAPLVHTDRGSTCDSADGKQSESAPLLSIVTGIFPLAWQRKLALMRSSVIGSIVGMLPGAGADMAAWIAYAVSKRFSRSPEEYGQGSEEGLADATGANNAALGSAWIPALVFGIPGDSVTAIAIGVLLMKNITPGPNIFNVEENTDQATLVYCIYLTFIIANIILIGLGTLAIRTGSMLIRIPRRVLLPAVTLFCVIGSFALNGSYFDVVVMLAMGLLGFGLERFKVPLGPVVLGLLLGSQLEHRFIQCWSKTPSIPAFFASPISLILAVVTLLLWISPFLISRSRRT